MRSFPITADVWLCVELTIANGCILERDYFCGTAARAVNDLLRRALASYGEEEGAPVAIAMRWSGHVDGRPASARIA